MKEIDYILFERFLAGDLSEKEVHTFNTQLKNDSEFSASFSVYKEAIQFLQHNIANAQEISDFKANLDVISNTYFDTYLYKDTVSETKSPSRFLAYLIAASVVLIFGYFAVNTWQTPKYYDYNTFETISLTQRSDSQLPLADAEAYFNDKAYKKAIPIFDTILKAQPNNTEVRYYKAIALVEIDAFKKAEALLIPLTKGTSVYKNKAKWVLALSYLKQHKPQASKTQIKTIPKDAEDYKKAQQLLDALD